MASTSRLFRALAPRFGILWLTAAMLLVVSAAGWWTFHRDLYIEEREVIERALQHGAKVNVDLGGSRTDDEPSDELIPWDAPLRPPIGFVMTGADLSTASRDEFLRLPRLKTFWHSSDRSTRLSPGSEIPTAEFLDRLDFALPRPQDPTIDAASLDEPLPDGPDLDASETRAVAESLFTAWNAPRPTNERLLIVSRTGSAEKTTPDASSGFRVHWLEAGRLFEYEAQASNKFPGQRIETIDRSVRRIVNSETGGWCKFAREFDADFEAYRRVIRSFPHDDYPYHGAAFTYLIDTNRALRDMPRFDLLRAAKIDDVRYRVEFAPFSIPRTGHEMDSHGADPSIDRWTAIVRSDLNWVPEEVDVQATIHFLQFAPGTVPPGPIPLVRRASQRFRKEGDRVFLVERLERQQTASNSPGVWRGLYAVERNPELDVESLFDPERFDPEPWPERRELPWLRWYRVTFALGCGLAMFLVGRRIASWRGVRKAPSEAESDALAEERAPASEPA